MYCTGDWDRVGEEGEQVVCYRVGGETRGLDLEEKRESGDPEASCFQGWSDLWVPKECHLELETSIKA